MGTKRKMTHLRVLSHSSGAHSLGIITERTRAHDMVIEEYLHLKLYYSLPPRYL